ncbi:dimethyl sulfoxide reductase subunit C [Bibersteinia trehalosi Y31]|uniref:Dimethyl sulfoxide reductase subunit C n=1 Tax=Bibersteinia trehalosi Y31 TaxID=1261658 RepID=A0A179CZ11_BIBTR|nr:DmsC/YnfH family molybdoenzyme membrane anchor subunit [Bibersteinia trehalosi]OAQ15139.1 dimethyl sulfoxide reductase subunit C [Bibersteinia trehalosi Y31]
MGAGLHELPLVFFTVFAQAVVGAFIGLTFILATSQGKQAENRLHYAMTILWGLMALGFIASTTHLGSPERAFNALNRVGASDLSNEIFTGSTFFALGGAYWALATAVFLQKDHVKLPLVDKLAGIIAPISHKLPKGWAALGRIIVVISGVIFVGAMAKLYLIPTVPTWNSVFTPFSFGLTALLAGSALTVVLLQLAKVETGQTLFAKLSALFAFIAVVVAIFHYQHLAQTKNAIFHALDLVPSYAMYSVIRFIVIGCGIGLIFVSLKKQAVVLSGLGCLLIVAGELIARTLFYGTHMTVGLKALGG